MKEEQPLSLPDLGISKTVEAAMKLQRKRDRKLISLLIVAVSTFSCLAGGALIYLLLGK